MSEQPKFEQPGERSSESSIDIWAEEQALDRIIQKSRAKRLEMKYFIGHYGKETIAEDQAVVEALEKRFNAELERLPEQERAMRELSRKRGEALEIIIAEHGELSDWFGPDAMTTRTAKIDDYRNRVDLVIEFNPEEAGETPTEKNIERLALAVDASDDPSRIIEKMGINQEKLTGRRPSVHVQYFHSQITDYMGPLNKIVPVVVGLEGKNMQELAHLHDKSLRGLDFKEAHKQLAEHPAQRVFIEEILVQLEWYAKLLDQEKSRHSMYSGKDIENVLNIMNRLAEEKRSISLAGLEEDNVMQTVRKIAK